MASTAWLRILRFGASAQQFDQCQVVVKPVIAQYLAPPALINAVDAERTKLRGRQGWVGRPVGRSGGDITAVTAKEVSGVRFGKHRAWNPGATRTDHSWRMSLSNSRRYYSSRPLYPGGFGLIVDNPVNETVNKVCFNMGRGYWRSSGSYRYRPDTKSRSIPEHT